MSQVENFSMEELSEYNQEEEENKNDLRPIKRKNCREQKSALRKEISNILIDKNINLTKADIDFSINKFLDELMSDNDPV